MIKSGAIVDERYGLYISADRLVRFSINFICVLSRRQRSTYEVISLQLYFNTGILRLIYYSGDT